MKQLIEKIEKKLELLLTQKSNNDHEKGFDKGYGCALRWILSELEKIDCDRCIYNQVCQKEIYDKKNNKNLIIYCSDFEGEVE